MGYAWAPQITGLIRGEPGKQRHRSNGKAILMEAMEERASKSPTLDRSRSGRNKYWHRDGEPSGSATWDAMCAEADAYRIPVKLKNGKTAERGLRGDAVIGWAAIIKPPPEMVAALGMSVKDVSRFCRNGFDALCQIEPRLFRVDNLRAMAGHVDEGSTHIHYVGTSKDKAGRYCGNVLDAALCVRINQEWPGIMRGMGWPIDDLDVTDWDRAKTDAAYRAERDAKRKRQGRSVGDYTKQRAEGAGRAAARTVKRAKAEAQQLREDAGAEARQLRTGAEADARQLRGEADEYARRTRRKADEDAEATRAAADRDAEATRAAAAGDAARMRELARRDAVALQRQRDEAEAERDAARADRDKAKAEADGWRGWIGKAWEAHQTVQTALQGDFAALQVREAREGVRSLLAASGAVVRPLLALNGAGVGSVQRGLSSAMARLQTVNAENEARWTGSVPSVECGDNGPRS